MFRVFTTDKYNIISFFIFSLLNFNANMVVILKYNVWANKFAV